MPDAIAVVSTVGAEAPGSTTGNGTFVVSTVGASRLAQPPGMCLAQPATETWVVEPAQRRSKPPKRECRTLV